MSEGRDKTKTDSQSDITVALVSRDFERMVEHLEKDFENFWGFAPRMLNRMTQLPMVPVQMVPTTQSRMSVDLEDRGKDFRLTADLPGFNREDVDVEITESSVLIQAKKSQTEEEKSSNYIHRERAAQTFYRRISLPEKIDSETADAKLTEGTLQIILPKKEPTQAKKLAIT